MLQPDSASRVDVLTTVTQEATSEYIFSKILEILRYNILLDKKWENNSKLVYRKIKA